MQEGLQSLSVREAEVLRLLAAGHDAKSVARSLGLSVHTVNERLRDARRKLGVSSSREAARLLVQMEGAHPNLFVDKKFGKPSSSSLNSWGNEPELPESHNLSADKKMGVALAATSPETASTVGKKGVHPSFAWLAGGIMGGTALIFAAFYFLVGMQSGGELPAGPMTTPVAAPPVMDVMPIADTNNDGKVTAEEYKGFSEQGWGVVSQGKDQVTFSDLDQMSQMAFFGILPNGDGVITRQMYVDAIPSRFRLFDQNGDGSLSPDEINGRAFER